MPNRLATRWREALVACATGLVIVATASGALAQSSGEAPMPEHHHPEAHESPSLFASRDGSGTAWLPDETPVYGIELMWGGWQVMLHASLFGQFLYEPGDRHRTGGFANRQVSSVNWGMIAARRRIGAGRIGLRAMLSAEPWTVSDCGFLNYLQTGETCDGDTIHDRQHPHDVFMELAAEYDHPVHGALHWHVYAALAGEPALGPVAFPHRPSAMVNPIAPVTHHWLDSQHISFGVLTTSVDGARWKGEVSVFNGREPDANRANLDLAPLDSIAGRVSYMPTPRLVVQVSSGHLRDAEAEFPPSPRSDVTRTTASITYGHTTVDRVWAAMIAYGVNAGPEVLPTGPTHFLTHAGLAEASVTLHDRHEWFGRVEVVGKPAEALHAHEFGADVFPLGKFEAGYVRALPAWYGLVPGVGGVVSINVVPIELAAQYSGRVRPGFGIFFMLRPGKHRM